MNKPVATPAENKPAPADTQIFSVVSPVDQRDLEDFVAEVNTLKNSEEAAILNARSGTPAVCITGSDPIPTPRNLSEALQQRLVWNVRPEEQSAPQQTAPVSKARTPKG